jgi:hypothetical protein
LILPQARLLPPQREWMGKILVCSKVFLHFQQCTM